MKNTGYIYIMFNPSFKDNLIKIGYTDNPERRRKELSRSSGVPTEFIIYATYKVHQDLGDLTLHSLIDKINPSLRLNKQREFYKTSAQDAYSWLKAIATISDTNNNLKLYDLNKKSFESKNKHKSITNKNQAIKFIEEQGCPVMQHVNYGSIYKDKNYYWLQPTKNVLNSKWSMILNDNINKKLLYLIIPKKSLRCGHNLNEIHYRNNSNSRLDLQINCKNLIDIKSKIDFNEYVVYRCTY